MRRTKEQAEQTRAAILAAVQADVDRVGYRRIRLEDIAPILAAAGEKGVRKLPPDVMSQIDRMKKERGI